MTRISKIAQWSFIVLLSLIATCLTLLGGFLVYLGGSPYYVGAGLATIAVVVLMIKRNALAPRVYSGILALTLAWALYESDLVFLSLLPRVAAWFVLGLWFLTPWYRSSLVEKYSDVIPSTKFWIAAPSMAVVAILLIASFQGYTQNGPGTVREIANGEPTSDWRNYGNTPGGSRFAQLQDINTETVGGLKEIWRYRTGVEEDFKATPLNVNGMLYICAALNVVIAIDDATGKEIWSYMTRARVESSPAVAGHRVYIGGNAVTDPKEIERRTEEFQKRAFYYYEHWERLYDQWKVKMKKLIADAQELPKPHLPEFEPLENVHAGKGVASNHYLLDTYHKTLEGYFRMWHHHFEFLLLGYGAYMVFFDFCKKAFPEITDQTIARMVAGFEA